MEGSASFDLDGRTAVTDASSAQAAIGEIEGFFQFAVDGAARLGAAASRIGGQQEFLSKQADATKEGLSALIETNIEEAAVKLKSFQVQQQLGYNSLSIANAAPQSLLGLY
nr:flagellin [Epibacterium ulvae]